MRPIATAVLLASIVTLASAGSLQSDIAASNKAFSEAIRKKDLKTIEKLVKGGMTPDFVYIEGKTKTNAETMLSNMKMGVSGMSKITVAVAKSYDIKQHGKTGTSKTNHTMKGEIAGPDKKMHTMVFTGVTKDEYVNVGGKWKMSKMEWISQSQSMDGKKMPG
jgi:hypothetical protein